jgi:signal transduction histidine kinase
MSERLQRLDPDKVFERFNRADPSRDRATGGSGLGRSLAREIARAHDGDLMLASVEAGRITFVLTLPVKGP